MDENDYTWRSFQPSIVECTICYARMMESTSKNHHIECHPGILLNDSNYRQLEIKAERGTGVLFEQPSIPPLPENDVEECKYCGVDIPSEFYSRHIKHEHNGENSAKKPKKKRGAGKLTNDKFTDENSNVKQKDKREKRKDKNREVLKVIDGNCANKSTEIQPGSVMCDFCKNIMPTDAYDRHLKRKHAEKAIDQNTGNSMHDNGENQINEFASVDNSDGKNYEKQEDINRVIVTIVDGNCADNSTEMQPESIKCAFCNSIMPTAAYDRHLRRKHAENIIGQNTENIRREYGENQINELTSGDNNEHAFVTVIDGNCADNGTGMQPEKVTCGFCNSIMPTTAYDRHLRRKHAEDTIGHDENQTNGNTQTDDDFLILTAQCGDDTIRFCAVYYSENKLNQDLINGLIRYENNRFFSVE